MKIYKFEKSWGKELFAVREIEVEEKPKTYVGIGTRINKDEINVLSTGCFNHMYCLENEPQRFIVAMVEKTKREIETYEKHLAEAKENLERWEAARAENEVTNER